MKFKTIFCLIALGILELSCKESQASPKAIVETKATGQTDKEIYPIPSGLKIETQEEVDIDNDEEKEVIITATDANATNTHEFWFKKGQLLHEFVYPWGSINKKWLINLDDDAEKEIVRIQGDEDGADYVIYDISGKQQKPILYFNPVLLDNRFPGQYMWAYPNDIKDVIVNQKKEIQVSLNNNFPRDDNHTQPENQKELPFLFFSGQTSQPDMKISKMNPPQFMMLKTVIGKVAKSNQNSFADQKVNQQWIGSYSCRFLRMKEESGDPRGWGTIVITIDKNSAKYQLDSYIENLKKELTIVRVTSDEIVLNEKDNPSSVFTISKNNNKYMLKSTFMDKISGDNNSYEVKKQ